MMRHVPGMVVLVLLLIGITTNPGLAIDPVLQQAQQKLSELDYNPGVADGIYGPRTRQALEAFQRAQKLPVTGILDTATLEALDRVTLPPTEEKPPPRSSPNDPLRVVLHYLRFYADQPARVLPYVTKQFRQGLEPREWIAQTLQALASQEYTYLAWKVQHLEVSGTQAIVEVRTRVRIQEEELMRQEVFTLRLVAEREWLIDDWRVKALPVAKATPQTGS
jgi:hypothetical protein